MGGYLYRPLDVGQQEIRILTLRQGTWDAEIECDLETVPLATSPDYEALSYVWGNAQDTLEINLHGGQHQVTRNLEAALRHLRQPEVDRTLWIDALCINQLDLAERAAQVRMMLEIYKTAANVVGWLGEATENSGEALKIVETLGQFVEKNQEEIFKNFGEVDSNAGNGEVTTVLDKAENLGFPFSKQNWPAVWDLLERPYWTRIWVIQELASRQISGDRASFQFQCGHDLVEGRLSDYCCALLIAAMLSGASVHLEGAPEIGEPVKSLLGRGHPPGLRMWQTLSAGLSSNHPLVANSRLIWLIHSTRPFQATDPRDKVFALIGLSQSDANHIFIDYEKSMRTLSQEVFLLNMRSNNDCVAFWGNRIFDADLQPSWLPHYTDDLPADFTYLIGKSFQAGGTGPSKAEFSPDMNTLIVKGVYLGRLERVIGPLRLDDRLMEQANPNQVQGSWDSQVKFSNQIGNTEVHSALLELRKSLPDDRKEAFWRTMIMNTYSPEMESIYPAPDTLDHMQRVAFGEDPPEDFLPTLPMITRQARFSWPFQQTIEKHFANRRFFMTDNDMMGSGPFSSHADDIVVVLVGCRMCVVLRPDGDAFRFVGEAYVHGAMEGQFIHNISEDQLRVFNIM